MQTESERIPEHPPFPSRLPQEVRRRRMLMTPQMVAIGGLLAFFAVVVSVVVLPTATYKPPVSDNWLPLSDAAVQGRGVFLSNGCVYCHSGFSRPQDTFAGSSSLYKRPSEPGDFRGISQSPNLLGTARTGPDLSSEGGIHPDNWHVAHYSNPRSTTPLSIMPRFSFLSPSELQSLIAFNQSQGGKLATLRYAAVQTGNMLMRLNMGMAPAEGPGAALQALIADLKQTGEYRESGQGSDKSPSGLAWMAVWQLHSFARTYWLTDNPLKLDQQNLMRGKTTYLQRCAGCHGINGDGKGPGAAALAIKPFDFTKPDMSTNPGTSSGMMYHRILTAGPGTAMENFGGRLSVEDIWRVVLFLRTIRQGGLEKTLPTVDMYEQWSPPDALLKYIETHPIEATYTDLPPDNDPFMQAARWIAPGMTLSDVAYVGGKLPMTLERLAGVIRSTYFETLDKAYNDTVARGEDVPPLADLRSLDGVAFYAP